MKRFSLTSGTTSDGRKLPHCDHLIALCLFVNDAMGLSALRLGRDL